MIRTLKWRALALMALTLLVGACADGGGESGTGVQPGRQPRETIHTGPITGFGSVFVNGIEFETGSSRIVVDGVRKSELDLAVGMIVTVRGVVDSNGHSGAASRVQYASDINGLVLSASISPLSETGTLNVMGRTVMITEDTMFDSKIPSVKSISQIVPGNVVEISGHTSGASDIHATRVALKSLAYDGGALGVKGVISNVTDFGFDIGTLHVNYPLASSLIAGWYVDASGTQNIVNNSWTAADVVKLGDSGVKPPQTTEGDPWTGQGVITAGLVENTFNLGEVSISVSSATRYIGGTSMNLVVDRRVSVQGIALANGTIDATQIEFTPIAVFGSTSGLQNSNASASTIKLLGATLQIDGETIFRDDRDAVRSFNLSNMSVGDRLAIRFAQTADGGLLATKIIRVQPTGSPDELSGPIMSENGAYSVAGIPISLSNCSPACKAPPDGVFVELEGTWTGVEFAVKKLEISDSTSGN